MRMSVILPSFNEPKSHETLRTIKSLFPEAQVIISPDAIGRGKGWAVRKGLLASCGEIIIFLDSDMDIHPRMIKRLLPFLEDYDIVVGCKGIGGMPLARKILTVASRVYIKILFWLDFDTQSGLKAMHKHAVLPWITDSFAFDLEFLTLAKRRGLKITDVPILAKITKGKSMRVIWRTLVDSLKIWFQLLYR